MNNFEKARELYDIIMVLYHINLHKYDYFQKLQEKYPFMTRSKFHISTCEYTNKNNEKCVSNLYLTIDYSLGNMKLSTLLSTVGGDGIKTTRSFPKLQYNPRSGVQNRHSWISKLGSAASMYYGNYNDPVLEYGGEEMDMLSPYQCNLILSGSTEELEFQLSTMLDMNDAELRQYCVLSLLTSDAVPDTVNILATDFSMYKDTHKELSKVLHLFEKGILTI